MPKKFSISEAEWKVMKRLWRKAPQPAYDLAQELALAEKWQPRTVKTLLNRLVKKRVLDFEKYKNLYLYSPRVTEEECVKAESDECFSARDHSISSPSTLARLLDHPVRAQQLGPFPESLSGTDGRL